MNEGSPNCHPAESAATTPRWLQRSWGNALESQLPRQKVNRETWLATDSLGAYERNKFNEPRVLHLPIQRMLNTDLWCSDCLLLLLQSSIEPDFPSCLLGAVFWVTRMLTPGLRVLNIPTKWKNSLLLGQMSFFFFSQHYQRKTKLFISSCIFNKDLVGECVISTVLSHGSKNLKRQMEQCYSSVLFRKQRKTHPRGVRACWSKREEKRGLSSSIWAPLIICLFLLPLGLPYVNWASQEDLRSSLRSLDLPFYFCRLFPSLSFSHLHSGLLFPILTS